MTRGAKQICCTLTGAVLKEGAGHTSPRPPSQKAGPNWPHMKFLVGVNRHRGSKFSDYMLGFMSKAAYLYI